MKRREFLGSLMVLGAQTAVLGANASTLTDVASPRSKKKKPTGRFDDNLVVFISDMHILPGSYQPERLTRVVNSILSMNPLPRNVIGLGDLAHLYGHVEDYECARELLAPLEQAGITLTLGMGNHDRRENFAQVFPERAKASLVPDRYVYIVETPRADIIVLDSLQQPEDTTTWITPGALDDRQREWLSETLMNYKKPVFVTAHHPLGETKVQALIHESPTCAGYIHGHDHRWNPQWFIKNYSSRPLIRALCLPSTGFWGDIGYSVFRLGEDRATMELNQTEYFFPEPLKEGEAKPLQWQLIEEDACGQQCTFAYDRLR